LRSTDPTHTSAPQSENVTINSTSASSITENATIEINAGDNFMVKSYYITHLEYVKPYTDPSGWKSFSSPSKNISENVTVQLSGLTLSDNMTFYVWLRDNATVPNDTDNYTTVNTLLTDNASPILSSVVISDNSSGSTDNATGDNVTLSLSATDTFGVISYYITDNASDNITAARDNGSFDNFTNQGTSVSENVTYTFTSTPDNGTLTLHVWVRDKVGNLDNVSDSINYYQ
jgi:hypothetical protein